MLNKVTNGNEVANIMLSIPNNLSKNVIQNELTNQFKSNEYKE